MYTDTKNKLLLILSLCFYLSAAAPANAEEIPISPDSEETHTHPDSENNIEELTSTPQPPLIKQTENKNYEPPTQDTTIDTEKDTDTDTDTAININVSTEKTTNNTVERTIGDTPQPPVIDAQPEKKYEPELSDKPDDQTEITTEITEQNIETPENDAYTTEADIDDSDTSINSSKDEPINETNAAADFQLTESNDEKKNINWTDTAPKNVSADWLQLTTGEWLRGRIIIMQKEVLEFDSDELDELEIDWEKVKYIKSSKPYSLRFDGRITATGAIEVTQNTVQVNTDYDDQTFNRSELVSIATGKETELSKWTNKITFSFNVRRGNTDQTDFTSKISAKRRTVNSRLLLDYLGNFTEIEETETINNHRINGTFDIFITRDLFVTPLSVEFFRDPFQNIESRRNAGVAIGYTIINTNKTEWDISGGPAYQETKFVSVQAGEAIKDETATLILSTRFDTEINSKVDLEGTYNVTLGDDTTGGYTHHALITVETEITDKLDFDVTGVWDRIKSPVQAEDGAFPEPDDFRILVGLGYDL